MQLRCSAVMLFVALFAALPTGAETGASTPVSASPAMSKPDACAEPSIPALAATDTAIRKALQPADTGCPKVVFQINQAGDAPTILRFVTNYLAAEPTARVVVVGYGGGVDFMLKGAVDAAGKPYADQVQALAAKGVSFRVCNNTLKARTLTADAVIPAATVVPGAVNEIIRLQTREGYAYFRH